MDKLEQLLQLLQAYGVKSYSDGEVTLEFDPTLVAPEEQGEFEVDFSAIEFPDGKDKPNEPN